MRNERKFIDWKKTGYNLYQLRLGNVALRRYVCSALNEDSERCRNERDGDCATCGVLDMDRSISRSELAQAFGVGEATITNWENARSHIDVENLLFYCQIAGVRLEDVLAFMQ